MYTGAEIEMPRYKSHKEIHALKIGLLKPAAGNKEAGPEDETDGGLIMTPADKRYAPIRLAPDFVQKHGPHEGGYYAVYKDGYKSFSPAEAFEDGYTLIEEV